MRLHGSIPDSTRTAPAKTTSELHRLQPKAAAAGGTSVLDTSYRSALKMETDAFVSNVNLHELGILADVRKLMVPDAHARLHAELYKLNM